MENVPINATLLAARERGQPLPFQFQATDVIGLAKEVAEVCKLVATEERDLLAIRTHYELHAKLLEENHEQTMYKLQRHYDNQSQFIKSIEGFAALMVQAGEYAVAKQIMSELIEKLNTEAPPTTMEIKINRLH